MSVGKKRLLRVVLAFGLLVAVGYLSNWVSGPAAERAALRKTVPSSKEHEKTVFRFSRNSSDSQFIATRLKEIGKSAVIVSENEREADPFPSIRIGRSQCVAPFVLRIDYCVATGPVGGAAGDIYVTSLFGWILHVADFVELIA